MNGIGINEQASVELQDIKDKLPMDFASVDIMVFICSSSEFPDHQLFKEIPRVVKLGGMVLLHQSSESAPGKMLIHLLDVSNQHICDQEVPILLVGYIRGLSNEGNVTRVLKAGALGGDYVIEPSQLKSYNLSVKTKLFKKYPKLLGKSTETMAEAEAPTLGGLLQAIQEDKTLSLQQVFLLERKNYMMKVKVKEKVKVKKTYHEYQAYVGQENWVTISWCDLWAKAR